MHTPRRTSIARLLVGLATGVFGWWLAMQGIELIGGVSTHREPTTRLSLEMSRPPAQRREDADVAKQEYFRRKVLQVSTLLVK
jgi:hypothetical protein